MVKQKLLILLFIWLTVNNTILAESLPPNNVVRLFIQRIQNNDLQGVLATADLIRIGNRSRHAMSPQQLVNLFRNVDLNKILFQKIEFTPWAKNITVRTLEPISYDFNLELQKSTIEKQEDYYIIVAVHP